MRDAAGLQRFCVPEDGNAVVVQRFHAHRRSAAGPQRSGMELLQWCTLYASRKSAVTVQHFFSNHVLVPPHL